MTETIECFDIREALTARGVRCCVHMISGWNQERDEWIANIGLIDADFSDDASVRAAFDALALRVEWIQHDIYSRFNETAGGIDVGGGKTWNVIFRPKAAARGKIPEAYR